MPNIGDRRVSLSTLPAAKRVAIQQAESPEAIKTILAQDGKIDKNEQAVLEEIDAELANLTQDESKTLTFDEGSTEVHSVDFGDKPNFKQETERVAAVARLSQRSTEGRSDVLRSGSNIQDVKAFLEADQKLAGTQSDGTKTRYGSTGPGASKVLMQDAFLLEKFGLLTETQKQSLSAIVDKLHTVKGYQGGDGMHYMEIGTNAIDKEDIATLDAMVEDVLQRLDGKSLPQTDYGQLSLLGSENAGTLDTQFTTIADNLDGLNAEFDASLHDLQLSYSEMGGGSGGKVAAHGRVFGRIEDAVKEVDGHLQTLNTQVLPTLEKQLQSLDDRIQQRIQQLRPDLSNQPESEISNALVLDPNLAQDPELNTLQEKKQAALATYSLLADRSTQLSSGKIKGLQRLSEVRTIDREEKVRTSSVNAMAQKLGQATGDLQSLQNQIEDIGKKHADPHTGHGAKSLGDILKVAQSQAQQPYKDLASAQALNTKLGDIRNNMITGMKGLIQTYETSSTANASAVQLLKKELSTLEALKIEDPAQAIEVLQEVREHLIGELGKQVGPLISKQEFMSLTGLDKKVTDYSQGDMATQGAANAKVSNIQEAIAEAKAEKQKTLERTVDTFSKFADDKMAYGTHAQVSFSVSAGLGVGTEEFGAYAGVGVEGTARIGKDFGVGPTYTATLDLDFIAEAKVKVPGLVDFEAKYSETLLSSGIGFNTMDETKAFVGDINKQLGLIMEVALYETALTNAQNPGLFADVDPQKIKDLSQTLALKKQELAATEQRVDQSIATHKIHNDKSSWEGSLGIGDDGHGHSGLSVKGKKETNTQTYQDNGHTVKSLETTKMGQFNVGHYGVKVNVQSSEALNAQGEPSGHSKERYGFYIAIPPEDVGKLLKKGASLSQSIGKETLNQIASKIVDAVGAIDPGAGLNTAFVIQLLEKQWSQATTTHAKDLNTIGHAADSHAPPGKGTSFHHEFLVGLETVYSDHKFQYAAVEAAYEASGSKAGRFQIPAGPIPLQGRVKVGFDAEVGVVVGKYKSNDYKSGQFMSIMQDLKPGMKNASGAEMLQQFAAEPGLSEDKKLFDYTHGTLKDMRAKFPEFGGLSDSQTLAKALQNPDKYLSGTFFADILKRAEGGGH
jgi:hypothetical protein